MRLFPQPSSRRAHIARRDTRAHRRALPAAGKLAGLLLAASVCFAGAIAPVSATDDSQSAEIDTAQSMLADAPQSGEAADGPQSGEGTQSGAEPEATEPGTTDPEQTEPADPDTDAGEPDAPALANEQAATAQSGESESAETRDIGPQNNDEDAIGCDYATVGTGLLAQQLCWIDMTPQKTASEQANPGEESKVRHPVETGTHEVYVMNRDVRITFDVSAKGTAGAGNIFSASKFATWSESNGTGAYLGNGGNYMGVSGRPAIYQREVDTGNGGNGTTEVTLSNIVAARKTLNEDGDYVYTPIPGGYSIIVADAESSDNNESITFTSTGSPFTVINNYLEDVAVPDTYTFQGKTYNVWPDGTAEATKKANYFRWGNACLGGNSGIGTTTVTCTGKGTPALKQGTMMLETQAPASTTGWSVTQSMVGGGKQGIAFGLMLRGLEIDTRFDKTAGQIADTDLFEPIVIADTMSADGTTLVSRRVVAENRTTYSDIRTEKTVTYWVGQRIRETPDTALIGRPPKVTDYHRHWDELVAGADADGTSGVGYCTNRYTGADVPITETNLWRDDLTDAEKVIGLDGETWTKADYERIVVAPIAVGVRDVVSCMITNVPHTMQVGNQLEYPNGDPVDGQVSAKGWHLTRAFDVDAPVTQSFADDDVETVEDAPVRRRYVWSEAVRAVRPGEHMLTAAGSATNAKARQYTQKDWTHEGIDAGQAGGAFKGSVTLPEFHFASSATTRAVAAQAPQAARSQSHFMYGYGSAAWTKVGVDSGNTLLGGTQFRLKDIAAVPGGEVEGTLVDGLVSDCEPQHEAGGFTCADRPLPAGETLRDIDPTAGRFVVDFLPFGEYVLNETRAPAGYLLDTAARYEFIEGFSLKRQAIDSHGDQIHQEVVNELLETPDVAIRKESWEPSGGHDGTPLGGAAYAIYRMDELQNLHKLNVPGLEDVATGQDGVIEFVAEHIPAGGDPLAPVPLDLNTTYYLREVQAPVGRELLPDDVPFQLTLPKDDTGRPVNGSPYFSLVDEDRHPLIDLDTRTDETDARILVVGNVKPVTLPVAGGNGSLPVIILGSLVIGASATALGVTRRRRT